MNFRFNEDSKAHLKLLRKEDPKFAAKVWDLLFSIEESPFSGIGMPEPLKGDLSGTWSRRITEKHRLVYFVDNQGVIEIVSCYGHYNDK